MVIAHILRALLPRSSGRAFLASTATIARMVFLFAMAGFPTGVLARTDPAWG